MSVHYFPPQSWWEATSRRSSPQDASCYTCHFQTASGFEWERKRGRPKPKGEIWRGQTNQIHEELSTIQFPRGRGWWHLWLSIIYIDQDARTLTVIGLQMARVYPYWEYGFDGLIGNEHVVIIMTVLRIARIVHIFPMYLYDIQK